MEVVCHPPGSDIDDVLRFRYGIYVTELGWNSEQADHERRVLTDLLDQYAHLFTVVDDGAMVGTVRVVKASDPPDLSGLTRTGMTEGVDRFGSNVVCASSRFMVTPEQRGSTAMLHLTAAVATFMVEHRIRLHYGTCSPHLLPFYEHMGFRCFAPAFNDPHYGWKFPLVMLTGDKEYARAVRSPLARLVRTIPDDREARDWFHATYGDAAVHRSPRLVDMDDFVDLVDATLGAVEHADLLGALDRTGVRRLLRTGSLVRAGAGDIIIRQGEADRTLYVLLSGAADVEVDGQIVAALGAGAVIGEMAFLGDGVRTASVVARTDAQLLVLDAESTEATLRRDERAAATIADELARVLNDRGLDPGDEL